MITLGMTRRINTTNFQFVINTNEVVTKQAPIANQGCNITEYFCLVLSYTTSPKKLKHILTAASAPAPNKKKPQATMGKF
jgi:hypothetical protein